MKDNNTEKRILEAAVKIFYQNGLKGARMQEIADEAGVNKALLHYYYRSKEKLFDRVYTLGVKKILPVIEELLQSDLTFEKKIRQLIEAYINLYKENPHIPHFIITEMIQNPDRLYRKMYNEQGAEGRQRLKEQMILQLQREMGSGNIKEFNPVQLMLNVHALCIFPFLVKPIVQLMFKLDDGLFFAFIEEHKQSVVDLILYGIMPRN